jgi:hypothetical protein
MIARFYIVGDNLLRGSAPSAEDLDTLKDIWNIKNIISLDLDTGSAIKEKCQELDLNHILLPLTDGNSANTDEIPNLINNINSKTYVHCRHGKDRTGMFSAIYRILKDNWGISEALGEASLIGMGKGLPPKVHDSYYEAVKRLANQDDNQADDAVDIMRDEMEAGQNPAIDSANLPGAQQSWAPFSDPDSDFHNRPASKTLRTFEKLAENRLSQDGLKLYKYAMAVNVTDPYWYTTLKAARAAGANDQEGNMYIGTVAKDAKVEHMRARNAVAMQSAMLNEVDVVLFDALESAYIINFQAVGISEMGAGEDVNNIQVGTQDNYAGVANIVFPGTQSIMNGSGFVNEPFGNQF